jgi:hypothetical protein
MISHPIVCVMFINLPCIILCFHWCCLFGILWCLKGTPCFFNSHAFFTQHCCLLMLL